MDDEQQAVAVQATEIPRNLDNLSKDELAEYKQLLLCEIERVEAEERRKQDVLNAAQQLFNN